MPHALLTCFYAALLTGMFIVLSGRVIARRRSGRVSIGVAGSPELERAARVHANFAEYVPMTLLAMLLVELSGFHAWVIHVIGLALLAGRAAHAYGMARSPEQFRFRVFGMVLTLTALATAALLMLLTSLFGVVF